MTDETFAAASAYFDNELNAEERAVAESDPAIMAVVADWRAVHDALAVVPGANNDQRREATIAAAVATFQTRDQPQAPPPSARWSNRSWLGVAAATLIIGLFGAIFVVGPGSGQDSATSSQQSDTLQDAQINRDVPAEALAADDSEETSATSAAATAASTTTASTSPEAAGSIAAEAALDDEQNADQSNGSAAPITSTLAPRAPDMAAITNEQELAAVGRWLIAERDARRLGATPEFACDPTDPATGSKILVLAAAQLSPSPDTNGSVAPVYVGLSFDDLTTYAIDTQTCQIQLQAATSS